MIQRLSTKIKDPVNDPLQRLIRWTSATRAGQDPALIQRLAASCQAEAVTLPQSDEPNQPR
jgi:hypothetical protein